MSRAPAGPEQVRRARLPGRDGNRDGGADRLVHGSDRLVMAALPAGDDTGARPRATIPVPAGTSWLGAA